MGEKLSFSCALPRVSFEALQPAYALAQDVHIGSHFCVVKTAGATGIGELFIREPAKQFAHPASVFDRHAFKDVPGKLALPVKAAVATAPAFDEGVESEGIGVAARAGAGSIRITGQPRQP